MDAAALDRGQSTVASSTDRAVARGRLAADERDALLGRRISELGLTIRGSRVERLVAELYSELDARAIAFRPAVYLSDQWGCPDGTPLIGVPFYLVDARLERIESEMSGGIENDAEASAILERTMERVDRTIGIIFSGKHLDLRHLPRSLAEFSGSGTSR